MYGKFVIVLLDLVGPTFAPIKKALKAFLQNQIVIYDLDWIKLIRLNQSAKNSVRKFLI